jgi:hypothetical protein
MSYNDGNIYPARGWQERYSYGVNLKLFIFDINYQPEKIKLQNQLQEYYISIYKMGVASSND